MQQYTQGMVEGTLPYQQLQFQWQQTQNAAKGSGGGGGNGSGQYYLGKDGVWYKTQQEAEDSYQIEETPYMLLKDRLISGIGQMQRMYR